MMKTNYPSRISTGIAGLDEILAGGLIPNRTYLIRGGPGSGKTTLGLHFLSAGAARGERALYISLEEPVEQIKKNAEMRGFNLEGVTFLDLSPTSEFFKETLTYDIFSPAEVEREPITAKIIEQVEKVKPRLVFLDPMTQFRYLSPDVFQFRRQVLSFLRYLVEREATVMFSSEASAEAPDDDLQFISDGVISLENKAGERTIGVDKFRGSSFRAGRHGLKLDDKGIVVYPRLIPIAARKESFGKTISSGIPEIDELLGGGVERGTVTIISGPSGVGKTTLGLQFMKEAAGRGERSVVYSFEEEVEIMIRRAEAINIPARIMIEKGTLTLKKVEPLQYTPDEFAYLVRQDVEEKGTQIVMIDSVAGFRLSVRGEDVQSRLHALCKYLQNMGVAVFLITETSTIVGDFSITDLNISYLADNIIFLRYLEIQGEMQKAIGVLKKRLSNFEKTLRQYDITRYGIKVGRPLTELRGILTGAPEWIEEKDL
ncbi:MAG: ATPase domain-containing protein [Anaerolineales bacterium]